MYANCSATNHALHANDVQCNIAYIFNCTAEHQLRNLSTFERHFFPHPFFFLPTPLLFSLLTFGRKKVHLMALLLWLKIRWLILDIGENIWISQTHNAKERRKWMKRAETNIFFRGVKLKVHMSFVMLKLTERKNFEQISFNSEYTEYVWNGSERKMIIKKWNLICSETKVSSPMCECESEWIMFLVILRCVA